MSPVVGFTERRKGDRRQSNGQRDGGSALSDEDFREMLRMLRDSIEREAERSQSDRDKLEARLLKRDEAHDKRNEAVDDRIKALEKANGRVMSFAGAIIILTVLLQWAGPTRVFRLLGQLTGGP